MGVLTHQSCQWHDVPDDPECPARLQAVMECMNNSEIKENLHPFDSPTQITRSRITMAHSQIHVDDIPEKARDAAEQNKMVSLDGDTLLSPHSAQSIMCASAAVCYAVDMCYFREPLSSSLEQHSKLTKVSCLIHIPSCAQNYVQSTNLGQEFFGDVCSWETMYII